MDIAVYTESIHAWPTHVHYAADAASALDAHLTGVSICPSIELGLPSFEVPGFTAEWAGHVRELTDEACKAEGDFLAEAGKHQVTSAAWQVAQGYVPERLASISHWHDLLVLGNDAASAWGSPAALGDIMLGCDIPCLIVPSAYAKPFALDCIAIAWSGTMQALRAVHSALPLLTRAQRVAVLQNSDLPPLLGGWRPQFDFLRYLKRHATNAQTHPIVQCGHGIGDDLLQAATEANANLLVMGCYGHTRLRERVLGGATREILEFNSMPVLMRH